MTDTTNASTAGPSPKSGANGAPSEAANEAMSEITFDSLAVAGFIFGLFSVAIAVFAVGLAARAVTEADGGGGTTAGSGDHPPALELAATEFAFDPSSAKVASTGTVTLTNNGSVDHDVVIEDQTSGSVAPGESGEFTLEGLDPGTYEYYCSIPGHREAGMQGEVEVG